MVLIDFRKIGISRSDFIIELKRRGLQTQIHYIPVHTQPFYRENFDTKWGDCPNAENYYEQCLSIPLFPAMRNSEIVKVVAEIIAMVQKNS